MEKAISDILEQPIYADPSDFMRYVYEMEKFVSQIRDMKCSKCNTYTLEPISMHECMCSKCYKKYRLCHK